MLGENDIVTYELTPEWYSVNKSRVTRDRMRRAILRQDLRLATALFPMSAETDIDITFGDDRNCGAEPQQ